MSLSVNSNYVSNINVYEEKQKINSKQNVLYTDNTNHTEQSETELDFTYELKNGQMLTVSRLCDNTDKVRVKVQGVDENNNPFEMEMEPETVDVRNASFLEIAALSVVLSGKKEYGNFDINTLAAGTENINEKMDYLEIAREYRDEEMKIGNMVGYHNSVKLCTAFSNFWLEQNDKLDYIEVDGNMEKAYMIDSGVENFDIGMGGVGIGEGRGNFHARYAKDSTVENPIIEVCVSSEMGSDKVYRVAINEVDIENATQLEMFAFCSYYDAKERGNNNYLYGESSYYLGFSKGFFDAESVEEFSEEKQNWKERLEDIIKNEKRIFRENWFDTLYDIFE